jgi:hypothetical protein
VRSSRAFLAALCGVFLASCSDSTGPGPLLECSAATTRALAVGEHQILDPARDGACVRLPAAGASGAEHLYIPLATEGEERTNGVSAPYRLTGTSSGTAAPPALPSPVLSAFRKPQPAQAFHSLLRVRERALSTNNSVARFARGRIAALAAPKPVVGDKDTFDVCSTTSCEEFVQAPATARSVGERVAIFVDDAAPSGGYTDPELDDVGALFDQHLYPIDTTAFGQESDIDANGVVIVLLTQRVNALSPDCNATQQVILGYFFGADLLDRGPDNPGSNEAEVFYGLVPDPSNPECTISKTEATRRLPATFIHEFQHMISFNQHVLVRNGGAEDTWLNEGLSHFAEELGARLVPDVECPDAPSCASQFLGDGNIPNAFEYLASPEEFFLIEPGNSTGKLEERGANWLFVRWLLDHFASDSVYGKDLTRQLVETNQVGHLNVSSRTGEDFSTLVGEWQLTNYLDDLPGFSAPGARLRYKTWDFRFVGASIGSPFPLVPDSTSGAGYSHSGELRAGSGQHVRIVQAPGSAAVDLMLTSPTGAALPATIEPRIALVRIR